MLCVLERKFFRFRTFVNVLSLFRYYLTFEKRGTFHLNKLESPPPKGFFVPWLVLEKKIFKFCHWLFHFFVIFFLGKGGGLHLNKFESLSSKDALCAVRLKLAQWFWRFLNYVNIFVVSPARFSVGDI